MTYDHNGAPLISGLWNGGVLEKGRRKGVGRAMASQRIEDALEKNFSLMTCLLMSEAMAWTYCGPLGFKDRFQFYPYFMS